MVVSAAAAHGVALEGAEARRGLPGIDDPRLAPLGELVDEAPRLRRDAAHPLGEVQRYPLAAEDPLGPPHDLGHLGGARDELAVLGPVVYLDLGVHLSIDLADDLEAGEDERAPGADHGFATNPGRNAGLGGHVSAAEVFLEGHLHDPLDHPLRWG